MKELLASLLTIFQIGTWSVSDEISAPNALTFEQGQIDKSGMLLTLNIPSVDNEYYADDWEKIVNFHNRYAKAVQEPDRVQVLVNKKTRPLVESFFDEGVLVTVDVDDIWMRDFSTINPFDPIQFVYNGGFLPNNSTDSEFIQSSFNKYVRGIGIKYRKTDYILDGGNIVDNYQGKIITTDRFLEDNDLTYSQGKKILADLYGAESVAILPADDEVLGHSDGMAMWADDDVLFVNKYEEGDFREEVLSELKYSFPGIKLIEIDVIFDDRIYDKSIGVSSACGINLNSVLTKTHIYVPIFGMTDEDKNFLKILEKNTTKKVVPIDAREVCHMGGSVRCLTWQQAE